MNNQSEPLTVPPWLRRYVNLTNEQNALSIHRKKALVGARTTNWRVTCLACIGLSILIGVPLGIAIWDVGNDPRRPEVLPPEQPPPPPNPLPPPSSPPPPPEFPSPLLPPMPPLAPGETFAWSAQFVLREITYSTVQRRTRRHKRQLNSHESDEGVERAALVESTVLTTFDGLDILTILIKHNSISNIINEWTVTLTVPEDVYVAQWQAMIDDPSFVPTLNAAWPNNDESLFSVVEGSKRVLGQVIVAMPSPPPVHPGPPHTPL